MLLFGNGNATSSGSWISLETTDNFARCGVPQRGGDGIRVDLNGNLWVAAGIRTPRPPGETTEMPQGIYVISPQGKLLGRIPIPEDYVTNLAFGGPDHKTLFVTAGTSIYKVSVTVTGYAVYPPLRP
jgi:gluconolactonase